eukprot:Hpha_TRINITY_DN9818_c0_g1::TRINITY_DN9818_c0_g1_i1::g.81401::m.81401
MGGNLLGLHMRRQPRRVGCTGSVPPGGGYPHRSHRRGLITKVYPLRRRKWRDHQGDGDVHRGKPGGLLRTCRLGAFCLGLPPASGAPCLSTSCRLAAPWRGNKRGELGKPQTAPLLRRHSWGLITTEGFTFRRRKWMDYPLRRHNWGLTTTEGFSFRSHGCGGCPLERRSWGLITTVGFPFRRRKWMDYPLRHHNWSTEGFPFRSHGCGGCPLERRSWGLITTEGDAESLSVRHHNWGLTTEGDPSRRRSHTPTCGWSLRRGISVVRDRRPLGRSLESVWFDTVGVCRLGCCGSETQRVVAVAAVGAELAVAPQSIGTRGPTPRCAPRLRCSPRLRCGEVSWGDVTSTPNPPGSDHRGDRGLTPTT